MNNVDNVDNLDYLDTVENVEHVDNMVSQSGKLRSSRRGGKNFWTKKILYKIIQGKTILYKKIRDKRLETFSTKLKK